MRLLVDLGNSRPKWAWYADGVLDGPYGLGRAGADEFERAWRGLVPREVVYCSVASAETAAELCRWVAARWALEALAIRPQAQTGAVRNAYREPSALGADRWANLLGARTWVGARDAVMVDAGTAVTVDGLRADGEHIGGAIFAGLAATRAGLAGAAPALPHAAADCAALPSNETRAALAGGTWEAHVGACERVARSVGAALDEPVYLLTGGDGHALATCLGPCWRHDPLLTMRGLLVAREDQCAG